MRKSAIARWLSTSPAPLFSAYAIVVSFSTYFCMYAFRKPFAAAGYRADDGTAVEFLTTGLDLKKIKALVDQAPQPIKQAARREEAQVLYEMLQAAGGTVEIKPTT